MVKSDDFMTKSPGKKGMDKSNAVKVEECSSDPVCKPRFSRKRPETQSTGNLVTAKAVHTEAEFCQQLLVDGYVQSYVDFYHLTHRADPNTQAGRMSSKIKTSLDDMVFLRDNLVQAEISRRQGSTSGVYNAYSRLADLYMKTMDCKTSIFFHEKCLEVAQLTADMRAEMSANHALGVVYQRLEESEMARKYHERHQKVAVSVDLTEEVAKANVELYKVYMVLADRMDEGGAHEEALDMYANCLEAAKKCWDKSAEGEANGKIGNLMLRRGDAQGSLYYLRQHSQISSDLGDAEGRCRACSALALALDTIGQADKALVELTLVHSISEQAGDIVLQSKACRSLGTLYSKVGKLEESAQVLQHHFDLLKTIAMRDKNAAPPAHGHPAKKNNVSAKDIDLARVYVGISKGNLLMGEYYVKIQEDLSAVLDWKLARAEFIGKAVPPTELAAAPSTAVEEEEEGY